MTRHKVDNLDRPRAHVPARIFLGSTPKFFSANRKLRISLRDNLRIIRRHVCRTSRSPASPRHQYDSCLPRSGLQPAEFGLPAGGYTSAACRALSTRGWIHLCGLQSPIYPRVDTPLRPAEPYLPAGGYTSAACRVLSTRGWIHLCGLQSPIYPRVDTPLRPAESYLPAGGYTSAACRALSTRGSAFVLQRAGRSRRPGSPSGHAGVSPSPGGDTRKSTRRTAWRRGESAPASAGSSTAPCRVNAQGCDQGDEGAARHGSCRR
jgi:hypothetical protein